MSTWSAYKVSGPQLGAEDLGSPTPSTVGAWRRRGKIDTVGKMRFSIDMILIPHKKKMA